MKNWLAAFALVFVMSCAPQGGSSIDALETHWDELWEDGDVETLVTEFYAADATLAASGEPDHTGHAAILENYRALKRDANLTLNYQPQSLDIRGDLAVRVGTFSNTYTDPATGAATPDNGRYVVIYRRSGGRWQAALDMETSQNPQHARTARGG